jgi:hypothetical protein
MLEKTLRSGTDIQKGQSIDCREHG